MISGLICSLFGHKPERHEFETFYEICCSRCKIRLPRPWCMICRDRVAKIKKKGKVWL